MDSRRSHRHNLILTVKLRDSSVHPGAVQADMLAKSQLSRAFPSTDDNLVGDFVLWATTEEAKFLAGRFVCANWDMQERLFLRDDNLSKNRYVTTLAK